mmetsp:Transcript_42788/g.56511  ORF Transcript_42788/g.56511 Transcript_42788/m.56511 type:complete len:112 (-) Transcript_42788:64-399(-)
MTFSVQETQSEIHGFAGYFTAELYQDVFYSITPEKHTPTMQSWFPLYFPIRTPLMVKRGQAIKVQIWRNNSNSKVWYEWAITLLESNAPGAKVLQKTPIHNTNGRGYSIGL